jgi:hypothetical protein
LIDIAHHYGDIWTDQGILIDLFSRAARAIYGSPRSKVHALQLLRELIDDSPKGALEDTSPNFTISRPNRFKILIWRQSISKRIVRRDEPMNWTCN